MRLGILVGAVIACAPSVLAVVVMYLADPEWLDRNDRWLVLGVAATQVFLAAGFIGWMSRGDD
jgi:hypothetical protein